MEKNTIYKANLAVLQENGLTPEEINIALRYISDRLVYAQLYNSLKECGHECENDYTREEAGVEDDWDWGYMLTRDPEDGYILLPTGRVLAWA